MTRTDLKNLSPEELVEFLATLGEKPFRARQLLRWIYQRDVTDFGAMTDLSKDLRARLAEKAEISDLAPEQVQVSCDGTRKYLFRLGDGQTVESVRIPMDEGRTTLCISSQVGCAMACSFCLTGTFGLVRNLTAAEIVNQVLAARRDGPVNNIVFMGMGEPLHNLDNVVRALRILYAGEGLNYGPRRVTLSTSGLVPEMRELGRQIRVGLAVSLNATTNELRDRLMPVNRRYPIEELLQACRDYPLQPRERITFEYVLLGGINDTLADAKRLVRLMHGVPAKINLIQYNEHDGSDFKSPSREDVETFQGYLLDHGLVAVKRASKGQDILAACGQLKAALEHETGASPVPHQEDMK
ncbi:MAG: 23S rRNA (adenine(2503)-C(2))-methyltransferase RlmN [Deltaproteobacteria bacterium]|nr:MAG: 23S rRNA (adenine(2503)-C(2))-methyltransferase RlmN [Deltaproteobacteria bacterium]